MAEDSLQESFLFLQHMDSRNQTLDARLGSTHPYPLSHLTAHHGIILHEVFLFNI